MTWGLFNWSKRYKMQKATIKMASIEAESESKLELMMVK
jgi:hypothetical protein